MEKKINNKIKDNRHCRQNNGTYLNVKWNIKYSCLEITRIIFILKDGKGEIPEDITEVGCETNNETPLDKAMTFVK